MEGGHAGPPLPSAPGQNRRTTTITNRHSALTTQHSALRTVFFGTPEFAVPALERLAAAPAFDVALVVTQPDRPVGRGRRPAASPVKVAAERLGLPLYQPESLRSEAARAPLVAAGADLFVVAAFGLIFGRKTLAIPRLGALNLHASLLPRYHGASPIAAAILCGDAETGISLMRMDVGLDTGPVIATAATPIAPDDTTASLAARLAGIAGDLAVAAIPRYASGELPPVPQPENGASLTRPLTKADGWLDWARPPDELARRVRAMWPWPRAWTTLGPAPLQVHKATVVPDNLHAPPGEVRVAGGVPLVACGDGALRLDVVQPAGGRPMPGAALVAGRRLRAGDRLGIEGAPPPQPPLVVEVDGAV